MAEAAQFNLTRKVLVKSFGGFGAQFNQHVFARVSPFDVVPETAFADLEKRLVGLAPQLVRIFQSDSQEPVPFDPALPRSAVNRRLDPKEAAGQQDRWDSFAKVAELAQKAGATVNITWAGGPHATPKQQETSMARFANVLERLVKQGRSNIRWVTIANEPNRVKTLKPVVLAALYRELDQQLVQRGLRKQIKFMGGDLVEGPMKGRDPLIQKDPQNRLAFFKEMSEHLSDLLDAYSVHIYWNYDDVGRFEERLTRVHTIVGSLEHQRPVFITEFGVRGKDRRPNTVDDPGNLHVGSKKIPLRKTNVAAFQHAWFLIRAAQLGYHGMVKWDCYFAKYDKAAQAYYALGRPDPHGPRAQWQPYPMYFLLQLFTLTTAPGWKVLDVQPHSADGKHLAGFRGAGNELTIFGLHQGGAQLNSTAKHPPATYTVGGLPAGTPFKLLLWNKDGKGRTGIDRTITTDRQGVARVPAPLHSVFALTTRKLPQRI